MSVRRLAGAWTLACAFAVTPARADPPKVAAAPVLTLVANPIFGADTSMSGFTEVVLRVENTSGTLQRGAIEIVPLAMYGGDPGTEPSARAPFSVPAGRAAIVKLPIHGAPNALPTLNVVATGEGGAELAKTTLNLTYRIGPMLVDVDQPSRLGVVMRGWTLPSLWDPGGLGYSAAARGGGATMAAGAPQFDRTTGDPILPDRAAGYAGVTALLIHSDALVKLDPSALEALVNWVLAGGTLAVIPNRPEDLRSATLGGLTGGAIAFAAPPAALMELPGAVKPPETFDDPLAPTAPSADPLDFDPTAKKIIVPIRAPKPPKIGPMPETRRQLVGFAGGNLRPSDWGATAAYGVGEVHLLAFDPTVAPMLDDPWVHARVVDMLTRAWDRRSAGVFEHGAGEREGARVDEVRRALDPNENFRPGLALSAILLVLYSIVAGPIVFLRATRRGKPLEPLLFAPFLSALAFGGIVLVGFASKGWRGRARHLSLVESSAGMSRASVRRFRGFFASETRSLAVSAADRTGVLQLLSTDSGPRGTLQADRNGLTLENLTSLPWQTVVVTEDAFVDLKGGLSVLPTENGDLGISNHTGRDLVDVIVYRPDSPDAEFFAAIKDGARVVASEGRSISGSWRRSQSAGARTVHPLDPSTIRYTIGGAVGERFERTWGAIHAAAGESVDWLPDGTPVVIGEMTGGEKAAKDSGLTLESDRVLFRVVGKGGAP